MIDDWICLVAVSPDDAIACNVSKCEVKISTVNAADPKATAITETLNRSQEIADSGSNETVRLQARHRLRRT